MTEVFGKPVTGEKQYYTESLPPQGDPDEIRQALDDLFSHEEIEAIRWEQYTPYFNDGEPCEFGVHEASIKLVGDDDGGDYEDGFVDLWSYRYKRRNLGQNGYSKWEGDADRVSDLIGNGRHEVFMHETFGDPAQVTATREGFSIEFYEHD